MSEFILVAVASAIVIYEYNRSAQKEEEKQYKIEQEKREIQERIQDLEFTVEKQSTQLKELTRLAIAIRDDLQKSLLPKPSKGFFGKKDTSEVPNVPPLTPELMNVFEKDKPRRDNNSENSQCSGDVNSIGDKLKNVSHVNEGVHYNSKPLYINKLLFQGDEDHKYYKLAPGAITRIVEEHFVKDIKYELHDL